MEGRQGCGSLGTGSCYGCDQTGRFSWPAGGSGS